MGPFLFNLYINDVVLDAHNSKISLYADDSKLYSTVDDNNDVNNLTEDLRNIEFFFAEWQLNLNQDKCEVHHLGVTNQRHDYMINNQIVTKKQTVRDLGIQIGEQLSFKAHIASIVRTAYFRLKQFNDTFECRDRDFLKFMYTTYIRPILESNTQIWSPYLLCDIDSLERVQKRFTKSLPGLRNVEYRQRLATLNLDSLESRRIFFDLTLLFKICNRLIDIDFSKLFEFSTANTRGHNLKLNVKFSRLNARKYFFCNRVISIWNDLPGNVVESETLTQFKNKMKKINLESYCRGRT